MMNRAPLLILFAVSACGTKDPDSQAPTTGTWTTHTGGTGTLPTTGKGGSGGSGSSTNTITTFVGTTDIDFAEVSWTGTESARVLSVVSGTLLCQWTWTALDWAHDPLVNANPEPAVAPCVDGDGNPCQFAFTVNLSAGAETDGLCGTYGFQVEDGAYHYGYAEDWSAGGTGYGPQFAYYMPGVAGPGFWFPVMEYGAAAWTPGTGNDGQLLYEIRKTLLGSYVP